MKQFLRGCFVFLFLVLSNPCWAMETREYVDLLHAGNFSKVEEELTNLINAKEKDTDGMYAYHRLLNRISDDLAQDPESSIEILNKWCDEKNSFLAYLLRGKFYADFAWEDRGGKFAKDVLPEAWAVFKERLALSQKDLEHAAQLNPASAEPWVALMMTYRGLGLPLNVEESFQKAAALDNNHYGAYLMMLTAKMQKWFGSHEEMFDFARKAHDEHKDDPVFAFLLIEANDELASRMAGEGGKRSDYYKQPVNYKAVRSLIDEILQVYPKSIKAMSWLVTVEYFNGNYPEVFKWMEQMGDQVDEDIWGKKESFLQTKAWLERQHAKGVF